MSEKQLARIKEALDILDEQDPSDDEELSFLHRCVDATINIPASEYDKASLNSFVL